MSTDTENICQSFTMLHEMWSSPLECAVALYLLYMQLGAAALAPVIVTIRQCRVLGRISSNELT